MEIDLASLREGTAERYVPELMRGELIEAEHLARYQWARPLAPGRRVLDAGCGMAFGSVLMLEGGAQSVVGVDIAEAVLNAVRPEMPNGVNLDAGDLRTLSLPDDSVDLVVCFETIEHFADPDVVLDQLARVLAPTGILAVSSPNRAVSVEQNPYHYHEYTVDELRDALSARFGHVALTSQRSFAGSLIGAIADPGLNISSGKSGGDDGADDPGSAGYLLALASDSPLPLLAGVAALGPEVSWEQWTNSWAAQQEVLDREKARADAAEARLADRDDLQRRLLEAEQLLASLPERDRELAQAIAERDYAVQWARSEVATMMAQRSRLATFVDHSVGVARRLLR
jgi:SAM-dependent methyltransferase